MQLGKEKQAAKSNSESLIKHVNHSLLTKNLALDKLNGLSTSYVALEHFPKQNYPKRIHALIIFKT